LTVAHDRDAVTHGKRLFLIVGNIDERNVELLLIATDFDLHFGAELAVEIGKGLIEEEQCWA
jgi:hypothetical protein